MAGKEKESKAGRSALSLKKKHHGARFWLPKENLWVTLEGDEIKRFEKEFSNKKGYEHFFEGGKS